MPAGNKKSEVCFYRKMAFANTPTNIKMHTHAVKTLKICQTVAGFEVLSAKGN